MALDETNRPFYKNLFISDVHLGLKAGHTEKFLEFLKSCDYEHLYLVGDIIDSWRLKKSWYFPDLHQDCLDYILEKSQSGTKVTYIPGNHDAFLRKDRYHIWFPKSIHLHDEIIFETQKKKRYLVIHGDQLDEIIQKASWLAHTGDWLYQTLLLLNKAVDMILSLLKLPSIPFALYLKRRAKQIFSPIAFHEKAIKLAKEKNLDGIICGHSHKAADMVFNGLHYLNTGDWVQSMSAVVEDEEGQMHLIDFADEYINLEND